MTNHTDIPKVNREIFQYCLRISACPTSGPKTHTHTGLLDTGDVNLPKKKIILSTFESY